MISRGMNGGCYGLDPLSFRFAGDGQEDDRDEDIGEGDHVMCVGCDYPGEVDLAGRQN